MKSEIQAIRQKDPAARWLEPYLYPWLHAIALHKHVVHPLYLKDFRFMARVVNMVSRIVTGIDIHPGAKLGSGGFIDHGMSVVIWETAELGDGFVLFHEVTLWWTGKDSGKRHPTVGKNVFIGAWAKILWPISIGDDVKIWANSVVLEDVPSGSTVAWNPAVIKKTRG